MKLDRAISVVVDALGGLPGQFFSPELSEAVSRLLRFQKDLLAKEERSWICQVCGKQTWDSFMLTDRAWAEAGLFRSGFAHLLCVEQRLGRKVTRADLKDVPINHPLMDVVEQR